MRTIDSLCATALQSALSKVGLRRISHLRYSSCVDHGLMLLLQAFAPPSPENCMKVQHDRVPLPTRAHELSIVPPNPSNDDAVYSAVCVVFCLDVALSSLLSDWVMSSANGAVQAVDEIQKLQSQVRDLTIERDLMTENKDQ